MNFVLYRNFTTDRVLHLVYWSIHQHLMSRIFGWFNLVSSCSRELPWYFRSVLDLFIYLTFAWLIRVFFIVLLLSCSFLRFILHGFRLFSFSGVLCPICLGLGLRGGGLGMVFCFIMFGLLLASSSDLHPANRRFLSIFAVYLLLSLFICLQEPGHVHYHQR